MKTLASLRVSKDFQDVRTQRCAILACAPQQQRTCSDFLERSVSSRGSPKARQRDVLLARRDAGDTLVGRESRRIGQSVWAMRTVIAAVVQPQVRLVAIKDGLRLEGKQAVQRTVLVTLFRGCADTARVLIALRTTEGFAAAWTVGKRL
jgi:hypothetical protein